MQAPEWTDYRQRTRVYALERDYIATRPALNKLLARDETVVLFNRLTVEGRTKPKVIFTDGVRPYAKPFHNEVYMPTQLCTPYMVAHEVWHHNTQGRTHGPAWVNPYFDTLLELDSTLDRSELYAIAHKYGVKF
jgi:hypothetical protein